MQNLNDVSFKITNKDLFKKLGLSLSPATIGSAGFDVSACIEEEITLAAGEQALVPLGFAMHINNPNWAALLLPRSGLGAKNGIILGNTIGLIDSDYQGEVMAMLWNRKQEGSFTVEPGMRIAQIIFTPIALPTFSIVDEFDENTERGTGGFGSTGTQ